MKARGNEVYGIRPRELGHGPTRSECISRKIVTIETKLKDALNNGSHQ